LIPYDDIRGLSLQVISVQSEIEACEQDRDKIEHRLNNLENDLKSSIKQGQSSEKELYDLRKKVETYREDLRNNHSQISKNYI
jgi:predicted  nucleic acid-binding Zn-ribbon protein